MKNIKSLVTAILTSLLMVACGGGGGSSSGNNGTASSLNIQTYSRDPSIAFGTTVNGTISTAVPSVTLPNNGSTDFVDLNINVQGYQPTWYPLTARDNMANIQVGLYGNQTINRKNSFIKGIIPHDAGGWLLPTYQAGYFPTTFDRIKNITGANTVVYADSAIMHQFDPANNIITMGGDYFPPNSVVADMGSMARSKNMDLMMLIGFYPGDANVNSFYSQIYNIPANRTLFWDAFFNAYKAVLIERAALAVTAGVTHMAIGFNLDFMIDKGNGRWIDLINAVRSAGFRGKISYFASTNYGSNSFSGMTESEKNSFIQLFDEIGMTVNAAIIPANPSELQGTNASINSIKAFFNYHINSFSTANVPVLVMIATASTNGNVISGAYIEPGVSCLSTNTTNYQQQADVYEAAAEVINNSPSVGGLLSWGYAYKNNLNSWLGNNDSCMEQSASVRGKQAEAVLKYWFSGW